MTERVKPEKDWRTVQGAVSLVGMLAVFAENGALRARHGCAMFLETILESASVVAGPASGGQQDTEQNLR